MINNLLNRLCEEQQNNTSGGIYHTLQVLLTYNSNHIEGSQLTQEQTCYIFETNTMPTSGEVVSSDDILETIHHFQAVDYCIAHVEEDTSEALIKQLHYIIKHDTSDSRKTWFNVGDYKQLPNSIGGIYPTVQPEHVGLAIGELLDWYNSQSEVTLGTIVEFHVRFEKIHPFQDGNGRVGRLVAFHQALHNNVVPFIVEDNKKLAYYEALQCWDDDPSALYDFCKNGQHTIQELIDYYRIV